MAAELLAAHETAEEARCAKHWRRKDNKRAKRKERQQQRTRGAGGQEPDPAHRVPPMR